MGFSENAVARSMKFSTDKSYEGCAQWLVEHSVDDNLNDPLPETEN